MAKQKSEEKKRDETRRNLKKMMVDKNLKGQIFEDKLDEYMSFYDSLKYLNKLLKDAEFNGNTALKNYADVLREKRMVTAEMRNILCFLGLKPDTDGGGGSPEAL